MKKFSSVVLVVLLSSVAWSQDLPKFDAPLPSQSKILQMHYEKFNDWASKHAPVSNEVDYDNIAQYYARLRLQSNASRLADKPALRAAMSDVRKWNQAYYSALYDYMGGGSMYSHSGNRSLAALADVESEALDQWALSPKPTGRLEAASFASNHKTRPDGEPVKGRYAQTLALEAKALAAAQASVAKLPPGPRTVLAKYLHRLSTTGWR